MRYRNPLVPRKPRFTIYSVVLAFLLAAWLAACGASEPEPTVMASRPTWTPTPYVPPTATPVPPTPTLAPTATPAPTNTPEPQPTVAPRLAVTAETALLRSGPGEGFDQIGTLKQGGEFVVIGRTEASDWWQVLVNKQPMWIAASQVQVTNPEGVAITQEIPTPLPPTATAVPPTAAPTRPRATVAPRPTNTPAPPPVADACAGIGGDGCKFKVKGGPAFTANGGGELKLTLAFVHGGRNDEAQGSYFIWLEKDGVKLPVPDSVRSWTGEKRQGPHGVYNYEHKLGLDQLPGNSVAGCYTGWVLDGNGERDSQTVQFCVPEGQGEVWIRFDQS